LATSRRRSPAQRRLRPRRSTRVPNDPAVPRFERGAVLPRPKQRCSSARMSLGRILNVNVVVDRRSIRRRIVGSSGTRRVSGS
jgi:hypothetical protein